MLVQSRAAAEGNIPLAHNRNRITLKKPYQAIYPAASTSLMARFQEGIQGDITCQTGLLQSLLQYSRKFCVMLAECMVAIKQIRDIPLGEWRLIHRDQGQITA